MNILIVDDHKLYIEGFRAALCARIDDCQVYGASTAEEATSMCSSLSGLDLVLVDVHLHGLSGLTVFDILHGLNPELPIAFISGYITPRKVFEATRRGVRGFVSKRETIDGICKAVKQLSMGLDYFSPGVARSHQNPESNMPRLTVRQSDILALMSEGLLNKQIAGRLGCSENTVKVHVRSLYALFGVHTRTACIRVAQECGIIDLVR